MKDNRGEISIMMIITVIVLIIFGGICIFMLTGEKGLFVPRGQEQTENTVNGTETNNTVNTNEEQNVTNNENQGLTVPMQ